MKLLLPLLMSLGLASCGDSAPKLTGEALAQRRNATRQLAMELLTRADGAFLGREDLVIRDERLLGPAVERIITNVETWMDGDEGRLRTFLETQVNDARRELITSPEGIAEIERLARASFAKPKVTVQEGTSPGRPASDLEKTAASIAGTVLSGRPAEARDLPASPWMEVRADFGLIPAPLEGNPRNKNSVSLLRHRLETSGEWLDDIHHGRPRLTVVEQAGRDLLRQHPKATRVVLLMQVLRTLGAPITWEFEIKPTGTDGELEISGTGTAPGYHEDFGVHQRARAPQPP